MNRIGLIFMLLVLIACNSTKNVSENQNNNLSQYDQENKELQFGCYEVKDTLSILIAYFPEEKMFYINNKPCEKENLCERITADMDLNKPLKHYYEPKSNFLFMMSIVKELEKCYNERIDEIAIEKFGSIYEELDSIQKVDVDSKLTYRMLSK